MLRLFRDQVGAFVAPNRLLLARFRGAWKSECVAEQALPVTRHDTGDDNWSAGVALLRNALLEHREQRVALRVVVSDQWAHYDVLPWSPELRRESERLTHARYLLESTYGDLVDQWTVALSDAAPGVPRLISALPQALIEALLDLGSIPGVDVVNIQPLLVATYNLWRHRLPDSPLWFVSLDESTLAAMHLTDGRCDRVRSVRISDDWDTELQRIQALGRLAQSRSTEGAIYVDAPLHVRMLATEARSNVNWLETDTIANHPFARLAALRELHP